MHSSNMHLAHVFALDIGMRVLRIPLMHIDNQLLQDHMSGMKICGLRNGLTAYLDICEQVTGGRGTWWE